jgi:usherin
VYTFEMHISTSAGSLGDQFNVSTPSAAPELQSPPQLSLAAATTILIQWEPPTYPNGLITSYSLSVEPPLSSLYQLTYSGNESSAILDNLTPFTNYTISISSFNDAGSATSHPSLIMTSETAPDGFEQAIILSKTSYSLYVTWDPPSTPNGVIINYTVIINNEPAVTLDIDRLTYNVSSLKPYTSYNISVIACNNADCVSSPYITDITNQAVPLNVSGPDLFATTSGPVIITWAEPDEPNGIIRNYTIYKSNTDDPFTLLTTVMATNNLRYNDSNVQPFTSYEYFIEATNDAGSTSGPSHTVTTSEAAPQGVNAPLLTAVSSTSIMLTIHPPDIPNGVIIEYVIHRTVHPQLHHTIYVSDPSHVNVTYLDDSLSPYTYYCYYIEACTGISCTSGPLGCTYTLEALPGDISAPIASGPKADVYLIINWEAPAMPNGIILNYTLIRYDLGFTSVSRHNCCVEYIRDEDDLSDDCVVIFMTPNPDDSYIDGSLDYYTYYEYCVVANNMIGSVASPQSSPIRTGIAPRPIAGPNITAIPLNSTAIFISWAPLGVEVLLGPFDGYTLYYNGTDNLNGNITLHVEDYILSGLTPNTLYSIKVSLLGITLYSLIMIYFIFSGIC